MKLFHFSDTHLGFSEYHKIDPATGLNQREQDFYDAWDQVIEAIFKHKPDIVVHAGDLFHTSRPTNRAIRVALQSIQKINDAGIPTVVISGNHSTPRIQSTGSIFESIALFPGVHAAYRGQYEKFTIDNVDFHCVPHCSLSEDLENAFKTIEFSPSAQKNVLVCHGAWSSHASYSMGELNENRLPDPELQLGKTFDYIALGHYHRRIEVKEHVCYSGATERTSFNEHANTTGYLLVNLDAGTKDYFEIDTRPMLKLPALNCAALTANEIYAELEKKRDTIPDDAMVSLTLFDVSHDTFIKLDSRTIDELFPRVLHLEKHFMRKTVRGEVATDTAIDVLPVEFERFLEKIELKDLDKNILKQLGSDYLSNE